jgi:hypothetical protein
MDHIDGLMQSGNLKAALKKYDRRKRWRATTFLSAAAVAFGIALVSKLSNLEWLVVFLAFGIACFFEQQRKHIRAMQIRLAMMADVLDRAAGNEPQDCTLLELSEA